MKYFSTTLKVFVSEFEFDFHKIVEAENREEAETKIREYASTFYDDKSEEIYSNCFEFFAGCPIVEIKYINEVTKEEWLEAIWERALI